MGDGPTKVEGSLSYSVGIMGDVDDGGLIFEPEYKYYGKGSCHDLFKCPELFLPCPKYIFPFPPLFCDDPPLKIQHFKIKSEKEMANERIAGFINNRAGKELIPLSDADSIEVSQGKANDGEMKIRVVTKSVRLFIVKADGTIYEETLEEERVKVGEMSREDASALIASLYGKKELGRNPAPSDKHIESVTKDINGGDDMEIFLSLMRDIPLNVPPWPYSPHEDDDHSGLFVDDPFGIRFYINF